MKTIRKCIEEILNLEQKNNRVSFIEGLTSDEQVEYKYKFAIELIRSLESGDFGKTEILNEMIESLALSPEAAVIIIVNHFDNVSSMAFSLAGVYYDKLGLEYYHAFNSIYYLITDNTIQNAIAAHEEFLHTISFCHDKYTKKYGNNKNAKSPFVGRCAVYTVITGKYDKLHDPEVVSSNCDYYCFTDDTTLYKSDVWNIRPIQKYCDSTPIMSQRYSKMHPHVLLADYDWTVYIDGKFIITSDLDEYINSYSRESGMLCFPHPSRNSLREEADAIIYYKKVKADDIYKQIDDYYKDGYNDEIPLVETGCLVRSNHDKKLIDTMEMWWSEVEKGYYRDQLSFVYSCWKTNYDFDLSDVNLYDNKYLRFVDHLI